MQMNQPALLLLADDAHLGNLTKPGVVFVAILITRRHPHHLTNRASYHHLRRRTPCLDRALTNPNDLTPATASDLIWQRLAHRVAHRDAASLRVSRASTARLQPKRTHTCNGNALPTAMPPRYAYADAASLRVRRASTARSQHPSELMPRSRRRASRTAGRRASSVNVCFSNHTALNCLARDVSTQLQP